jgi:hypothetical protein
MPNASYSFVITMSIIMSAITSITIVYYSTRATWSIITTRELRQSSSTKKR